MINFPRKTSSGSFASCDPKGVKLSLLVRALTSFRESIARRIFLEDGGSNASRSVCSTSPSLQILTRSTRSCRDRRSISGVCCSASYHCQRSLSSGRCNVHTSLSWRYLVKRWKQIPFCTRPARPRRCLALAREMKDSTSRESCLLSSNLKMQMLIVLNITSVQNVPHCLLSSYVNNCRDIGNSDTSIVLALIFEIAVKRPYRSLQYWWQ